MTFQEWISYLIKRFLWYIETPKEERRKKENDENWPMRWFGLVPFSMKMMLLQMKNRFPNRK